MYFGCCIYVLLLLNMPEMAHDWIDKVFYSILCRINYSILFYSTDRLILRKVTMVNDRKYGQKQ